MRAGPSFKRWATVLALGCSTVAAIAAAPPLPPLQIGSEQGKVLIYWGAGDCGPCIAWKKGERKQEFLKAAQARGITLVEIERPRLADPASMYRWPAAHAALAERYRHYPAVTFTPSFDFVCKAELVRRLDGLADWDSFWSSALRRLDQDCASAQP